MEAGLLEQGLELMLVGMGTVFLFLTLLVLATSLMSRFVQRFAPAPAVVDGVTEEEVAAITAAIARHRHGQRQRSQ